MNLKEESIDYTVRWKSFISFVRYFMIGSLSKKENELGTILIGIEAVEMESQLLSGWMMVILLRSNLIDNRRRTMMESRE